MIKPMLAKNYMEYRGKLEGKEFIITPKLDGIRAIWDGMHLLSRTGKPFEGLEQLKENLNDSFYGVPLDGELMAAEKWDEPVPWGKTMHQVKGVKKDVHYHIFDCPIQDKRTNIYGRRIFLANHCFVRKVPMLYRGTDESQIKKHLETAILKGLEGIMINIVYAPYENKRTKNLLKVKQWNEEEFECVDFEWGMGGGKYEDMIGALVVRVPNSDANKDILVGIGTGLTDADRRKKPGEYVGKLLTVKYFEKTPDGSLRFPVFKGVRDYD